MLYSPLLSIVRECPSRQLHSDSRENSLQARFIKIVNAIMPHLIRSVLVPNQKIRSLKLMKSSVVVLPQLSMKFLNRLVSQLKKSLSSKILFIGSNSFHHKLSQTWKALAFILTSEDHLWQLKSMHTMILSSSGNSNSLNKERNLSMVPSILSSQLWITNLVLIMIDLKVNKLVHKNIQSLKSKHLLFLNVSKNSSQAKMSSL